MKNYINNKIEDFCIKFIRDRISKGYGADYYYDEIIMGGVSELHFEKLQAQTLYDALSEIETLTEDKIIKEIIKITKQRYELDKIIHAKQLFKIK